MAAPGRLGAASAYASRPTSSFGYWRGGMSDGPLAQGQGSRYGQANSGGGMFMQGQGPPGRGTDWSPTVTYLIAFVIAEMILFKLLERVLR
jgi:hypothetical protein